MTYAIPLRQIATFARSELGCLPLLSYAARWRHMHNSYVCPFGAGLGIAIMRVQSCADHFAEELKP